MREPTRRAHKIRTDSAAPERQRAATTRGACERASTGWRRSAAPRDEAARGSREREPAWHDPKAGCANEPARRDHEGQKRGGASDDESAKSSCAGRTTTRPRCLRAGAARQRKRRRQRASDEVTAEDGSARGTARRSRKRWQREGAPARRDGTRQPHERASATRPKWAAAQEWRDETAKGGGAKGANAARPRRLVVLEHKGDATAEGGSAG